MSKNFDAYAAYYDLLYQDKNYAEESRYVTSILAEHGVKQGKILELGCGTGGHAAELAKLGFEVHGIDISPEMIKRATNKLSNFEPQIRQRVTFDLGDVRSYRNNQKYDAVISLFHVASYQTVNGSLQSMFDTASTHLKEGGLFLFDYWYGHGVLYHGAETRVKRLENEYIRVLRIAEPIHHHSKNVIDVCYEVHIEDKTSGQITIINETHPMRYFFLPELDLMNKSKFNSVADYEWLKTRKPQSLSWNACKLYKHATTHS